MYRVIFSWIVSYPWATTRQHPGDIHVEREGSDLSESDEEQLFVGEVDGGQTQFTAVLRRPVFVRVERRLQSTTVGNVLAQRLTASQLQTASNTSNLG